MLMESQTDKKPCPAYGAPIFREPSGDDVWVPGSVVSWLGFALETYSGFRLLAEKQIQCEKRRQFPLYFYQKSIYLSIYLSGVW